MEKRLSVLLQPILAAQSRHAREFLEVAGHDSQAPAPRMAGDEQVIGSDHGPLPLELRANVGGMVGRPIVERKHVQPRCEILEMQSPSLFSLNRRLTLAGRSRSTRTHKLVSSMKRSITPPVIASAAKQSSLGAAASS
jgi:hypothetical protein